MLAPIRVQEGGICGMNAQYEKRIGRNLRELRLSRFLTQEQVAAQMQLLGCDITRSALAKIEVGQRHLYPDEIKALSSLLQVSLEEILID